MIEALLTAAQREQLLENGRQQRDAIAQLRDTIDFKPVVKLIAPDTDAMWLLSEVDSDENIAFGLCDLGIGCPEVGNICLRDLTQFCGPLRHPIVRDDSFVPRLTIGQYAELARSNRNS